MANLHEILEKARAAGHPLAYNEAAVLFAAVMRLAAGQNATLRARLVQIDEAGGLHVAPFDDRAPESEPGYEAPELLVKDPPRRNEPRVQVYAAGALGYELLTGRTPPRPGSVPGAELGGPLGDIVRMALAPDRRERFGDLAQLREAIEGVQPRPPAEGERNIFAALRTRLARPPPEKEAVAKVIDRLHHVESQAAALAKAHAKLETTQRQMLETVERFADGQRRAEEVQRRRSSSIAPGLLAGAVGAVAVLGGAWALGMISPPGAARISTSAPTTTAESPPAPAAAAPEPPAPAPAPRKKEPAPSAAETPVPAIDAAVASADAGALASGDAGEEAEARDGGAQAAEDAGAQPGQAQAPPPAAPAPEKKRRPAQANQAAMQHALAVSQMRRGEGALEQGNADAALQSFRAALENEPSMAVAFRGLGMAYSMQGNDTQALQAYERYLKLAPLAPDAAEIRKSIKELRARSKSAGG
ncbi:MAG TPA: tetratricopeptide repeat protein [Myxococcales bacterium]|nr:tetratricopeptide repeat protein [Myxococcales bacterium]